MELGERMAPEGFVWQCRACGKTARDLLGVLGEKSYGWDVSCTMNAALVKIEEPGGAHDEAE